MISFHSVTAQGPLFHCSAPGQEVGMGGWIGRGCAELGAAGHIEADQLSGYLQQLATQFKHGQGAWDAIISVPLSASILWAVSDESAKGIESALTLAMLDTVAWIEDNAAITRRGVNGVAHLDVRGGVAAVAFRHYLNRDGKPDLHEHAIILNLVKGSDGTWGSLDRDTLLGPTESLDVISTYQVCGHIADTLAVVFDEQSTHEREGRLTPEIVGIDAELIREFSSFSSTRAR